MSANLKSTTFLSPAQAELLRNQERERVELGLPAHLLFLTLEEVTRKKVYEFRPDIFIKLNQSAVLHLAGLDNLTIARVAKKIDDAAKTLISVPSQEDSRHVLACSCFWILKLVDEGLFTDRTNMAVVVALLLINDMREMGSEWLNDEAIASKTAGTMLQRAKLLGYYHQLRATVVPDPVS